MNVSDIFFIALCVTVLILGAVYWAWTQHQHVQRKMNLLENIVYELKSSIVNNKHLSGVSDDFVSNQYEEIAASSPQIQPFEDNDEHDEQTQLNTTVYDNYLQMEVNKLQEETEEELISQTPEFNTEINAPMDHSGDDEEEEGLQPGGIETNANTPMPSDDSHESSLNRMTIKELRRLAEQRGLNVSKITRKQEIVNMLISQPVHTYRV